MWTTSRCCAFIYSTGEEDTSAPALAVLLLKRLYGVQAGALPSQGLIILTVYFKGTLKIGSNKAVDTPPLTIPRGIRFDFDNN